MEDRIGLHAGLLETLAQVDRWLSQNLGVAGKLELLGMDAFGAMSWLLGSIALHMGIDVFSHMSSLGITIFGLAIKCARTVRTSARHQSPPSHVRQGSRVMVHGKSLAWRSRPSRTATVASMAPSAWWTWRRLHCSTQGRCRGTWHVLVQDGQLVQSRPIPEAEMYDGSFGLGHKQASSCCWWRRTAKPNPTFRSTV
jgi:hypothetical protein